jgi:hypothetical protein
MRHAVSLPKIFLIMLFCVSGETAHGAVWSIVGLNHVAFAGLDRMRESSGESGCGKMINMLNGSDQTQLMFAAMQNNSHCVGWNKALTFYGSS